MAEEITTRTEINQINLGINLATETKIIIKGILTDHTPVSLHLAVIIKAKDGIPTIEMHKTLETTTMQDIKEETVIINDTAALTRFRPQLNLIFRLLQPWPCSQILKLYVMDAKRQVTFR